MIAQIPGEPEGDGRKRQIKDLLRRAQDLVGQAFDPSDLQQHATRELVEYHSNIDYIDTAGGMFGSVRREILFVNGQLEGFNPIDIERFRGEITAMLERNVRLSLI